MEYKYCVSYYVRLYKDAILISVSSALTDFIMQKR